MGIISRISELKSKLRKQQDKTLAIKSKEAKNEIRRQKFILSARKQIEEAKRLKKENSFLGRISKRIQENNKKTSKSKVPKYKSSKNDYKDSQKVLERISLGGNRKKPYDPFNL